MGPKRETPTIAYKMKWERRIWIWLLLPILHLISAAAIAAERLVLIGGGAHRPPAALKQFADWSGGETGQILIVAWASEFPNASTRSIIMDLKPHFAGGFQASLTPPQSELERLKFLDQLTSSTGLFFTGGDQVKIMNAFSGPAGRPLLEQLKKHCRDGMAIAGTSAGTAVMSGVMIAGDPPETELLSSGLGLLPDSIIVDQHFTQRSRTPRLQMAMTQADKPLGIGVDEDTAALIENNKELRVVGSHKIKLFQRSSGGSFSESHLVDGDSMNLQEWVDSASAPRSCRSVFDRETKESF